MSVLTIRAHRRFAVRRQARLRRAGKRAEEGLIIELSLDGCRISRLPATAFAPDQTVTLRIEGTEPLLGRIRWHSDGTVGLRFLQPLHVAALDRLIRLCRGEFDSVPIPLQPALASIPA